MTSCDICIAQDIDKKDTLFACEFQSSLSKVRTQFKPAVGWVATWRSTGLGWVPGPRGFLADRARACKEQASRKFPGANDTVCSSFSHTFSDWWRAAKSWSWNALFFIQILYSECDRILKSGTRCETCGCWYHNYCGSMKFQVVESGKWRCNRCGSERLRLLEEKLQNALLKIDKMKRKNKALEERSQLAAAEKEVGKRDTASVKHEDIK